VPESDDRQFSAKLYISPREDGRDVADRGSIGGSSKRADFATIGVACTAHSTIEWGIWIVEMEHERLDQAGSGRQARRQFDQPPCWGQPVSGVGACWGRPRHQLNGPLAPACIGGQEPP